MSATNSRTSVTTALRMRILPDECKFRGLVPRRKIFFIALFLRQSKLAREQSALQSSRPWRNIPRAANAMRTNLFCTQGSLQVIGDPCPSHALKSQS
jgi:hypothetical protein